MQTSTNKAGTSAIVECIPNFSEGRNLAIIDALASIVQGTPGVKLLHRTSDYDHHRSVLTFAGAPQAVLQTAYALIANAAQHIDLTQHRGQHPRVGATDVVPFVPIRGLTLADCVRMAQGLGQRVGDELGLPVYLYEAAATRPERRNLAHVRRGEYEGLQASIRSDPSHQPDYGPARIGKAGAVIIGAREALIAYNVFLSTDDVTIAKRIAQAVRGSSGGLVHVKALGLLVDGRAQVSMNLTDYRRTPLHRAVELIRREAARYGVQVVRSELIGLIPQQALLDAAAWYLQLDGFDASWVLENQLDD